MTERPILFSGDMVRAILAGRKTQTRRLLKNPPAYPGTTKFVFETHPFAPSAVEGTPLQGANLAPECKIWLYEDHCGNVVGEYGPCPYGIAGDRLWVREAWRTHGDGPLCECTDSRDVDFMADSDQHRTGMFKWRPSIFMPRWASRISLELTAIRVERLQDISEADAIAEGATLSDEIVRDDTIHASGAWVEAYRRLWESINGPGSWAANPWVWVLSFRRL